MANPLIRSQQKNTLKSHPQPDINVGLDELNDRDVVIALDKKPKSADKSLVHRGGVPFTITKRALIRLQTQEPGRYIFEKKYVNQKQIREIAQTQFTGSARIQPPVVHITNESGLISTLSSKSNTAADAIQIINSFKSEAEINKFITDEDRQSVLSAAKIKTKSMPPVSPVAGESIKEQPSDLLDETKSKVQENKK